HAHSSVPTRRSSDLRGQRRRPGRPHRERLSQTAPCPCLLARSAPYWAAIAFFMSSSCWLTYAGAMEASLKLSGTANCSARNFLRSEEHTSELQSRVD